MEKNEKKTVSKLALARQFEILARLLEIIRENPFKIRAYRFAARIIRNFPEDELNELDIKKLSELKGIGTAVVSKSLEFLEQGKISKLEEVKSLFPNSILKLSIETGLPSKIISVLWKDYGIIKPEGIVEFLEKHKDAFKIPESEKRKIKELLI
ncbi:MAG: DNA polymerase IV (family X)-like protein [Kosmotoga sp.]|uniref:DNA polymerase IV (family X)-like protein n=1 Tax=Kosmotoga sp. TaxID=1955248 RepID=UPI0025C116F4|nr:DNA polymerase IV (family X)-like protein [Kosmotoga sp.]MCD6159865.1 DNA polymerase IV (family X)-like protein [Kosmotoga sp.]